MGDLYTLDLASLVWRLVDTNGVPSLPQPPPLFSHTLTPLGRNHLVLIGGCPEQDPGESHPTMN